MEINNFKLFSIFHKFYYLFDMFYRLFTNTLLTQFNLKSSGGKIGLLSTKLYDVIEGNLK